MTSDANLADLQMENPDFVSLRHTTRVTYINNIRQIVDSSTIFKNSTDNPAYTTMNKCEPKQCQYEAEKDNKELHLMWIKIA